METHNDRKRGGFFRQTASCPVSPLSFEEDKSQHAPLYVGYIVMVETPVGPHWLAGAGARAIGPEVRLDDQKISEG